MSLDLLSKRQRQVFNRIVKGERITDIAIALNLSRSAVSTFRRRLLDKLNLENNAQLVRLSIKGEK